MNAHVRADIAILGSGFGGSLTALLLHRIGLRPVLLDRGSHPRFAIGESSTPTADLVLRDLTRRYDLPQLQPLSSYGTWRAAYPHLVCGLKRGFSYFHHRPGEMFVPRSDHSNELLVAASADDFHSDTHWLRSDVDTFLVRQVQAADVPYFDSTYVSVEEHEPVWRLRGERNGENIWIEARFLIDATGEAGLVLQSLGLPNGPDRMNTHSRALFAHFVGVKPWRDVLVENGACVEDHPFSCDSAALHHLLDGGWMWQLRFDNGVTSAGFVLDTRRQGTRPASCAQAEWDAMMDRYPSIAAQFAQARPLQPAGGLRRTDRLQRRGDRVAGNNWALLPHTAGFVDPLHSTGIAHTLCGIERLVGLLERHWERETFPEHLQDYAATVEREIDLVDELVDGCYLGLIDFRLFVSFAMLYFAAATTYEYRRVVGRMPLGAAFLCAEDPLFRKVVRELREQLMVLAHDPVRTDSSERFRDRVAQAIGPFNTAGLCDPTMANMYRYTAVLGK